MNEMQRINFKYAMDIYEELINKIIRKLKTTNELKVGKSPIRIFMNYEEHRLLNQGRFKESLEQYVENLGFVSCKIIYEKKINSYYLSLEWKPYYVFT